MKRFLSLDGTGVVSVWRVPEIKVDPITSFVLDQE
jgi:hypothetical protein